jgi:hypothetical protein
LILICTYASLNYSLAGRCAQVCRSNPLGIGAHHLAKSCWQQQHVLLIQFWRFLPCSTSSLESSFSAALDNGGNPVASLLFMVAGRLFWFFLRLLFPCVDLICRSIFLPRTCSKEPVCARSNLCTCTLLMFCLEQC